MVIIKNMAEKQKERIRLIEFIRRQILEVDWLECLPCLFQSPHPETIHQKKWMAETKSVIVQCQSISISDARCLSVFVAAASVRLTYTVPFDRMEHNENATWKTIVRQNSKKNLHFFGPPQQFSRHFPHLILSRVLRIH
jgi:hypothetical protein